MFSKDVPVENDRDSTIHLFLGRCCAGFLRFQINVILDLEAYYIDNTADNYKPVSLADEGGTKEDAWFHYGVDDCNDLILGAIPKNDLYLVDTDRDEILIFGAQALRYLWDAHDGVNTYGGDGCFYLQGSLRSAYRSVCTIEKWSSWKSKNENLRMLEAALANSYAISSNGIVHDLLPIVNNDRG